MRSLRSQISRRWFLNGVANLRRIKLDGLVQVILDDEQQSAIVGAEFLRVSRVRPITFGAPFHLSCLW